LKVGGQEEPEVRGLRSEIGKNASRQDAKVIPVDCLVFFIFSNSLRFIGSARNLFWNCLAPRRREKDRDQRSEAGPSAVRG
jgi:hypothetical protein